MTIDKTTAPEHLVPSITGGVRRRDQLALTEFVTTKAAATATEIGFGWCGTALAPSTYQQLRGAYAECEATGASLPIYDQHCRTAIYATEQGNLAFRFWHDVNHVRRGLSFSPGDELELALWHLSEVKAAGFDEDSVVHRLLATDLFSQIVCSSLVGRFPFDQVAFIRECLEQGLWVALLRELRRLS